MPTLINIHISFYLSVLLLCLAGCGDDCPPAKDSGVELGEAAPQREVGGVYFIEDF